MSPQWPQSPPRGHMASQTNTKSWHDISISHCITITPTSFSMHLKKWLSEEKARGSCTHFSLTSTSHISACTGPALAHSGGPVAVQQRHVTLGGRGAATLPPPPYSYTHLPQTSLTLHLLPYTPQFLVCPLQEGKGGACASWGGRCYVSDLPLHEIGFGDIRIKRSVALALPPPTAKLAIMPGVSNHFSVKIPTVLPPLSSSNSSPSLSLSLLPTSPTGCLSLSPLLVLLWRGGKQGRDDL